MLLVGLGNVTLVLFISSQEFAHWLGVHRTFKLIRNCSTIILSVESVSVFVVESHTYKYNSSNMYV